MDAADAPDDDAWKPRKSIAPLSDDEIKAVRAAAPLINGIVGAGVLFRAVVVIVKWGGCIILFGLALKNGAPLSQLMNLWPHG